MDDKQNKEVHRVGVSMQKAAEELARSNHPELLSFQERIRQAAIRLVATPAVMAPEWPRFGPFNIPPPRIRIEGNSIIAENNYHPVDFGTKPSETQRKAFLRSLPRYIRKDK